MAKQQAAPGADRLTKHCNALVERPSVGGRSTAFQYARRVELPVIDPANLLDIWMQWEKGEMMPGLTLSKLKKSGMRELIEQLVAQIEPVQGE